MLETVGVLIGILLVAVTALTAAFVLVFTVLYSVVGPSFIERPNNETLGTIAKGGIDS